MNTRRIDPKCLEEAASLLKKGEIVAFPTETVYGLGARIFCEEAVRKIFTAKGRPSDNPLIAHISNLSQVEEIARDIPFLFYELAENFFPGPLTVVIQKSEKVSSLVSGGLNSIAIRMPSHKVAQKLIDLVGEPLVAPSANLSGKPSSTHFLHVLEDFEGKIPAVVTGHSSEIGIESTVISLLEDKIQILRPGSISKEQIEEKIKKKISFFEAIPHALYASPGMKYRHYAPKAMVSLFTSKEELISSLLKDPERKKMVLANFSLDGFLRNVLWSPLTPDSFYSHLRLSDKLNYPEIFIFLDESTLNNVGFMNRLEKAAGLEMSIL